MKKVVRLTESDLVRLVKRVILEQPQNPGFYDELRKKGYKMKQNWRDFAFTDQKMYGEIKEATKFFNYEPDMIVFFENVNKGPAPIRFITDGEKVYFLEYSYPSQVKENFPNPLGPFKVNVIKKYL
jgi:hypothetical protein